MEFYIMEWSLRSQFGLFQVWDKKINGEASGGSAQSSHAPWSLWMRTLGRPFFLGQKSDAAASGHILQAGHSPGSRTHVVMQWAQQTGSPGQTAAEVSTAQRKYSHAHAQWHSDIKAARALPSLA